jgi:protein-arginine kinase activator protein McsA
MGNKLDSDERVKYIDNELYIQCRSCDQFKPENEYHKNKNNRTKRSYVCIVCAREGGSSNIHTADDFHASGAKEILINMGYDLNKDIHKQFLKRMKDKGRKI